MKTLEMMLGGNGMGDARSMAEMLRRMGRRGDTMLAHITPEEADMLVQMGGSGTTNPDTGLPEFAPRRSSFDDFDNYTPRVTSQPAGATFDAPNFELDTNYTPRRVSGVDVPTDFGFESLPYQAAGNQYDLMQYGRTPNVQTGGFEPSATDRVNLMGYGTGVPNVRTGGLTPEPMDVTSDFGVYGVRPGSVGLRPPTGQVAGISARALQQAQEPYFTSLSQLRPLEDRTAAAPQQEAGFAQRTERGLQELQDVLNRYPNLTRAGAAGASILAQMLMYNQASKEMQRGVEESRRAAQPFRAAQAEAMGRATGEGLTPEQQQELEIEQARARQGLTERNLQTGSAAAGVLAAQQSRARSLARKSSFDEALRLANIADQYDRRALELELQRDQQLGQLFAGILGREAQQALRTQVPVTETGR
jgi:hypothetical protein